MGIIDWPVTSNNSNNNFEFKNQALDSPKINILWSFSLGWLCNFQEYIIGQRILDKLKCYWEHIGEHIKEQKQIPKSQYIKAIVNKLWVKPIGLGCGFIPHF